MILWCENAKKTNYLPIKAWHDARQRLKKESVLHHCSVFFRYGLTIRKSGTEIVGPDQNRKSGENPQIDEFPSGNLIP